LDLSSVEAFSDLPDDSRDRLAREATVKAYAKGDAIDTFALAYVVRGEAHVIASGALTQAATLGHGAVLRARGTLEATIGLRLACASAKAVIATWDSAAVEAALGSCPWVEDELRATGDRIQALAGASLGTLGEKLSPDLRATIVAKMSIRAYAQNETIVTEGLPVPGILLVGSGTVDLVANQSVTTRVTAGQFVLPAEALSAGPSPASARAGSGGALVFAADRKTTQELFATEPLLLELFAGW
jgi:signal-transduction protein with cAMP-binding, CBS, and nucleotidyltransferase domain